MEPRLFRALVVFGASLTGTVAPAGCGSGVDRTAGSDASADGDYAKISPYVSISYQKISPPPPEHCSDGLPAPCARDAGDAGDAGDADAADGAG